MKLENSIRYSIIHCNVDGKDKKKDESLIIFNGWYELNLY